VERGQEGRVPCMEFEAERKGKRKIMVGEREGKERNGELHYWEAL
jgi:hypothetical protein